MSLARFTVGELESWRCERVTEGLIRAVQARIKERDEQLRRTAAEGSVEFIRRIAGALEELEWVMTQIKTEGVSPDAIISSRG
jgi:hypothetical protein